MRKKFKSELHNFDKTKKLKGTVDKANERLELLKIGDICKTIEDENKFIEKVQRMEEKRLVALEKSKKE